MIHTKNIISPENKKNKNNQLLVTVSGADRPGITAMLSEHIHKANLQILDMGQAVISGFLTLSILVKDQDLQNHQEEELKASLEFLKNILFECKELGLQVDFKLLPPQLPKQSNQAISNQNHQYALTCVAIQRLEAAFISSVTKLISTYFFNIKNIEHKSNAEEFRVIEFILESTQTPQDLINFKNELWHLSKKFKVDMAINDNDVFRFSKRLVVFDMDSTLIEQEVIDELAHSFGVGEKVKIITERAMQGEIDFKESLIQRVAQLKGMKKQQFENIKQKLTFTSGTEETLKVLKGLGLKTAVISGGFQEFTQYVATQLGLNYSFGNQLEWSNDQLTGNLIGPIIDAEMKASILNDLAQLEEIHLKQTVAVGDGSNDLKMLALAGMGVAFHAKEIVRVHSSRHLSHGKMSALLCMLGVPWNFWPKENKDIT